MLMAHAAAWAFGADKDARQRWHLAQEFAAGWHDAPRDTPMFGDPH